ncbi:MAG: hypothetical protein KC592_07755 [Nitrospira sp.]|nr:hypothetical protein [Nitrospira sp.]HBP86765.1 hypothetical protein [Nitrospiraceae bacterium]HNP27767.1 hypothetical protein [Nitrospirales bacterium]
MKEILAVCMTAAFIVGTASMGLAGQGMKSGTAEDNVPENIQRSTPSAESSLPTGSGPGSRSDQLTDMEDVDPKNPNMSDAEGQAAQAAKDLKKKNQQSPISSQSSSQKSH